MNTIRKLIITSAICAMAVFALLPARAGKHEIVSNLTNATFSSSGAALLAVGNTPADKVFNHTGGAALVEEAHTEIWNGAPTGFVTNLCKGVWFGEMDSGMDIVSIVVSDSDVVLTVEERFLIYTNLTTRSKQYNNYILERDNWLYRDYDVATTDAQHVRVEQDCNPPDPWTARGNWAPYCRDEMTNRTECIEHYEGVTREVIGYYDADGDSCATLSKVGVVHGAKGDYLDELADGPYWIVNDVLIAKYTIPRNSFLNFVYGTEDAQYHYWYAIKSLYRITLETTPLRPWWQMPEYQ